MIRCHLAFLQEKAHKPSSLWAALFQMITNRHPPVQTGPRPHPPTMDHILLSSSVHRRTGIPYKVYRRTLCRPSRYTRQDGTGVPVASNALISFMLTHFLNQVVQALVMLCLRNCTVLQKTIEQGLLFQEETLCRIGCKVQQACEYVRSGDRRGN